MKISVLKRIGAIFFPKRRLFCKTIIAPEETVCPGCRKKLRMAGSHFPFAGCIACYVYQDPVSGLIKSFKTKEQPVKAQGLAVLLKERMETEFPEKQFDLVVPVPMTAQDRFKRGFNQSELLGKRLAKYCGIRFAPCLKKVRQTKPQHTLKRWERLINVKNAFRWDQKTDISNKDILLIDDVVTTGSTLVACRDALKEGHPKSITCMAVAVSMPHEK